LYFQAIAAAENNRLDEAAEKVRQIFAGAPDYVPAHVLLADILIKQKKFDDAVAAYRKGAELQPENAFLYSKLGIALLEQGKDEDAVPVLRRAVELDAENSAARHNLGVALERLKKIDETIPVYREALERDPKNTETMFALGNVLSAKRDLAGAIAAYRKAIDLKPDEAGAYLNLHRAFLDRKEYAAAAAALRKAHALKPNAPKMREDLGREFEKLGTHFELQGDFEEAVACYGNALEIAYGNLPIAHYGGFGALDRLRWILKDQDTDDETLALYRKALRYYPLTGLASNFWIGEAGLCYESLFEVYRRQDRLDEALAVLEQHRKELPEDRRTDWILTGRIWGLEQLNRKEPPEDGQGSRKAAKSLSSGIDELRQEQRKLLDLDQRLPRLVNGAAGPLSNPSDRVVWADKTIVLARRCASPRWRLYGTAARLFLQEGDRRITGIRYEAARVLALAGCGQGADAGSLDDAERVRFRKQALVWLRADLKTLLKMKWNTSLWVSGEPLVVARTLTRWNRDLALAGVRDESALAKLPAAEREEWTKLWAEVAALRKKVASTPAFGL
jgi:tetratricopeptide (TPR) repeat protein